MLALLWASAPARAAVYDPALVWRTLATEHFRIHYPEGLGAEARHLADIAEQVHGPMTRVLGWTPEDPTEVTLVDRTDLANGWTTVVPYNQIVLYAVRPGQFSTLADYGDWYRTLFVHEYAHVLGLDPVRGYSAVMRRVFGRVGVPRTPVAAAFWLLAAPPNLFLPPWVHEGLATNQETDLTGRGRKGSTWYRMIYRVDVAEGTIPPLDRLGGDFPDWPAYATRYIYGARLVQVIEDRFGPDAVGEILRGHAGRVPYAIDAPPRRATGMDYTGLYRAMVADLEAEYRPEIAALERAGLTPYRRITDTGYRTAAPLWLDQDTLVYSRGRTTGPTLLVRRDLASGAERVLAERPGSVSRPTRLPGGRIGYPRLQVSRPAAGGLDFLDLYACDRAGRAVERLTAGARLRDVDYSPAAGALVAVQVDGPRERLVLLRLEGGRARPARTLLAEPGVRYDTPRWSPDGRSVAFSRKTEHGHARLAVLAVDTGRVRLVTPEGTRAGFPAWSPDGAELAFSWDRSGVFDLYAWSPAGRCRRLTRVLGGAFHPDWSPDGRRIAFTAYASRGFDVAVLDLADAADEPVVLPEPEVLSPARRPATDPPPGEPYSPWPRVLPTFWLPDVTWDNRSAAPGAWTAGHDPLLRHKYFLSGYWSTGNDRAYGRAIYVNDASYPTVTASAWAEPVLHTGLFGTPAGDLDYWEVDRGASAEVRLALPRALRRWSFAVSWAWQQVTRLSRVDEDLGGRQDLADAAFEGRLNPLAASVLYDSAFPYDNWFTVGPEAGRRIEAVYRLRSSALGSDVDRREAVGSWREYLGVPGLTRTTVALLAQGGTGWGDDTVQSVFQVGGADTAFPLRGYDARALRGRRAAIGSAELRFPVWSPFRGIRDLPGFLGRLHGAVFADTGRTWDPDEAWRWGAGGELRMDTLLGYYLPTTVVVGYARGFGDGGTDSVYLTLRGLQ